MSSTRKVFLQVISKPKRKVIVKRGIAAKDYWTYCEEIGCDVWGILTSIRSISGEPVCLWLPEQYIIPGTSEYVQGVEVDSQYDGMVPDGFDVLEFPTAKYLMFQGEPFSEEDYELAIKEIEDAPDKRRLAGPRGLAALVGVPCLHIDAAVRYPGGHRGQHRPPHHNALQHGLAADAGLMKYLFTAHRPVPPYRSDFPSVPPS